MKDRSETLQSIEKALVDLYEKIRDTTGGAGAAALVGGACGGCNLSINTVDLKLRQASSISEDKKQKTFTILSKLVELIKLKHS